MRAAVLAVGIVLVFAIAGFAVGRANRPERPAVVHAPAGERDAYGPARKHGYARGLKAGIARGRRDAARRATRNAEQLIAEQGELDAAAAARAARAVPPPLAAPDSDHVTGGRVPHMRLAGPPPTSQHRIDSPSDP